MFHIRFRQVKEELVLENGSFVVPSDQMFLNIMHSILFRNWSERVTASVREDFLNFGPKGVFSEDRRENGRRFELRTDLEY